MDIEKLYTRVEAEDEEFLRALARWKNSRPLDAVQMALVQVAFTSLYRDRSGSVLEHLEALDRLKDALGPPRWNGPLRPVGISTE